MKLLKWIFSIRGEIRKEKMRYRKKSVGEKIGIIVGMLLLVLASGGMELWAIMQFKQEFAIGFLIAIFAVAVIYATIRMSMINSVVAFTNIPDKAIHNAIENAIEDPNNANETPAEIEKEKEENSKHRTLDITIGVVGVVAAVITVMGSIGMIIMAIKGIF